LLLLKTVVSYISKYADGVIKAFQLTSLNSTVCLTLANL